MQLKPTPQDAGSCARSDETDRARCPANQCPRCAEITHQVPGLMLPTRAICHLDRRRDRVVHEHHASRRLRLPRTLLPRPHGRATRRGTPRPRMDGPHRWPHSRHAHRQRQWRCRHTQVQGRRPPHRPTQRHARDARAAPARVGGGAHRVARRLPHHPGHHGEPQQRAPQPARLGRQGRSAKDQTARPQAHVRQHGHQCRHERRRARPATKACGRQLHAAEVRAFLRARDAQAGADAG